MSKKVIVKQQSSQSPRTAVTFRSPIDFPTACIPVVLSYLFAYSHNLIHSYISSHPILPYRPQAPKNPTSNQARPAFPAPQTRHPPVFTNSLRRLPARYRMSRRSTNPTRPATGLHGFPATKGAALAMRCTTCTATSSGHIPAETSVRLEQIKLQSNSLKSPEPASHLRKFTRPTGLLKSPAPARGAWAWRRLATAASTATTTLRRCDASTPEGPEPACVIGLSGLKARLQSSLKA